MRRARRARGVSHRANYATVYVGAQLAPEGEELALDWASAAGDRTDAFAFSVPAADTVDPYVGVQAFDVGEYGHEIVVNGDPMGGFDIPPTDGWQHWIDTLTDADLREGENTVEIRRDTGTDDAFAIGTVSVHWKEPIDDGDA